MGFFSQASLTYVGVDIDSHSVKMVELSLDKGRPRLISYGYFDHDLDRKGGQGNDSIQETANIIQEVKNKARIKGNVAISALPAYSVFSSVLTMPEMTQKELASAIKWEAKKVIPLPLEDMTLHYDILSEIQNNKAKQGSEVDQAVNGEQSAGSLKRRSFLNISRKKDLKSTRILLTAAPKNLVNKFIEIFKLSGMNLLSLDTESFALTRSLVGNDPSTIMIVDIDFSVSNIMIIQGGVPYLNRSINVGGLSISQSIANSLNISLKRAEQFKYDIGLGDYHGGEDIPQTVKSAIAPILDEIKYSLNLYKNQGKEPIEKIILTGGSSLLKNFPSYISETLDKKVFLGDPWARIMYPKELKPVLDEVGPRFSVAIGLAMKIIK